jgi:catechol 2,3-dioxygenase-like lactoylglutathione lyase family enzyme
VIRQLRLAVTTEDYDEAVAFYRDVLQMPVLDVWSSPDGGRGLLLDAGRATLELTDPENAAFIDEVEVGRRGVAGHIRLALEVDDTRAATEAAVDGGAELLAQPTETVWRSLNSRLEGPGGLQLTLFEELAEPPTAWR